MATSTRDGAGRTTGPSEQQGRSPARERLLATASQLFYSEGIRSVGVERILAEVPTTRATFYRHFPSKEDLVLAYLRGADAQVRAGVQAADDAATSPAEALRALGSALAEDLVRPGFRGCAFLNAAAEFSDPDDPVRRAVIEHRGWYTAAVTDLFARVYRSSSDTRPDPEQAARHFLVLRDGAMSGAHLGDAAHVGATFQRALEGLLLVVYQAPPDPDAQPAQEVPTMPHDLWPPAFE